MDANWLSEELGAQLDQLAEELLEEGAWGEPPVDAVRLARRLGMEVALDERQASRARIARLPTPHGSAHCSILVRPDPRGERLQWAVAHEIGEAVAGRACAQLALDPRAETPGLREAIANHLAGRLLVPPRSFAADMRAMQGDLLRLKSRYRTASHELIARRMLELPQPAALTIFDNGRVTLRLANSGRRRPPLAPLETACRQRVAEQAEPARLDAPPLHVAGWPIHEPAWRREILRTTWDAFDEL